MKLGRTLLLFVFFPGVLLGQAEATATQGVRLFAYGMGTYVRPSFGASTHNAGATVGATANVFAFHSVDIGLDVRATGSSGSVSRQYVFSGGPRLQFNLGRFQPYAAMHLGYGSIHFQQPADAGYTHDNSFVTGLNAGVDYRLTSNWSLRGDVERQSWRLGSETSAFHPTTVSVGVRYTFHLRNPHGPE